jgi:hypothetical protein
VSSELFEVLGYGSPVEIYPMVQSVQQRIIDSGWLGAEAQVVDVSGTNI